MSLQQAYYTSCREGLRGTAGFQFQAVTPGTRSDHLSYLERLGVYVPPPGAPSRPAAEELAAFPVSLLYALLPDGAAVVARARYAGQDYSGRYGNFFTHSLVEPSGNLGLPPILLWGSPAWEEARPDQTSLPELAHPVEGGVVTLGSVAAFVREPGQREHLPAFLTAVERALSDRRRVLVVAPPETVALWVGAACLCLPPRLVRQLTFTTYIQSPYHSEALITGTSEGSDFRFSAPEMEHLYSVFDFRGGRFTRIEPSAFASVVSAAYLERPDLVAAFAEFSRELEQDELGAAFLFHALACGWVPALLDVPALLSWCERHGRALKPEALRHVLGVALGGRGQEGLELPAARLGVLVPELCPWLVDWMLCEVPAQLAQAALSQLPPCPHPALRRRWKARLRGAQGSPEMMSLLQLGRPFGWFEGEETFLRQLGESALGPCLPEIQGVLLELESPALLEGAGLFLMSKVAREPELFSQLQPMLRQPAAASVLKKFALEQRSTLLYFRIVAAQEGEPLELMEQCLQEVRQLGELSEAHLAAALECLWDGRLPTSREGLRLFELCGPLPQLGQILARSDLRRDDPARDRLADLVGSEHADAAVLSAVQAASVLRAGREDRERLEQALTLTDLPGPLREQLLQLVAQRLCEWSEPAVHRELLGRARENESFLGLYLEAARSLLDRPGPDRARDAARLALAWCGTDLREPLHQCLEDWPRQELRALRAELKEDPVALEWISPAAQPPGGTGPGLVSRMRGWWGR